MSEKQLFAADAGVVAALMANISLSGELMRKGIMTTDDGIYVYAVAASMCRGNGNEDAAKLIETLCPTCQGVDVLEMAKERGATIEQKTT